MVSKTKRLIIYLVYRQEEIPFSFYFNPSIIRYNTNRINDTGQFIGQIPSYKLTKFSVLIKTLQKFKPS